MGTGLTGLLWLPMAVCVGCMGAAHAAGAKPEQLEKALELKRKQTAATQAAQDAKRKAVGNWWRCLGRSISTIQKYGPGGYSTTDAAHDALRDAFAWDAAQNRMVFHAEGARPSFCSGAVYAAMLYALAQWDSANEPRKISPAAWQALLPRRVADGEGAWGQANANGPGLAVLVHRLGAGVSFTDASLARPGDFMKIWWNDKVGASERGHLVILVKDMGDSVRVWSSNQATADSPGGFGFRTFSKSSIKRVLYTRITNPAAFNNAPKAGTDEWLMSLLKQDVGWEECLRRAGARK